MKTIGGLLVVFGLMTACLLLPQSASAAACANTSTYGAVRLTVPQLPKKGEYLLWVRLQSPEKNGKILVEFNQTECLEVSSTTLQPNVWTWAAYQQNGQAKSVTFNQTEGNSLEVIGIQAGIKIDRVLVTELGCTPESYGNNCNAVEATQISGNDIQALPPPSDKAVTGKVLLSTTPHVMSSNLKLLSYSAAGRTVQTSKTAEPFDTTRIENGKYTVLIETTLNDGQVIRESTIITVDNNETVLSPVVRWLRQHQQSLQVIGFIIGGALVLALLSIATRKLYTKRRERHFHGF